MEKCAQDLGNSTKAVSSAIAQLLGEVAQGNENYAGLWAGPEWAYGEGYGRVGAGSRTGPGRGDDGDQGLVMKGFFPPFLPLLSSQVLQHGMWQVDCGPWPRPLGA